MELLFIYNFFLLTVVTVSGQNNLTKPQKNLESVKNSKFVQNISLACADNSSLTCDSIKKVKNVIYQVFNDIARLKKSKKNGDGSMLGNNSDEKLNNKINEKVKLLKQAVLNELKKNKNYRFRGNNATLRQVNQSDLSNILTENGHVQPIAGDGGDNSRGDGGELQPIGGAGDGGGGDGGGQPISGGADGESLGGGKPLGGGDDGKPIGGKNDGNPLQGDKNGKPMGGSAEGKPAGGDADGKPPGGGAGKSTGLEPMGGGRLVSGRSKGKDIKGGNVLMTALLLGLGLLAMKALVASSLALMLSLLMAIKKHHGHEGYSEHRRRRYSLEDTGPHRGYYSESYKR